jgi:hypothetical protein
MPSCFRDPVGWAVLTLPILVLLACRSSLADETPAVSAPTVGMPSKIEQLILPGSELEAKPIEDRQSKMVVRIVEVYPHGSSFRYNLVYYGLEPGQYDLKDFLRRKDGGSIADLPPIPVTIKAILPEGQIEPNPLGATPAGFRGGYRFWMGLGAVAWVVGLVAIILVGRRKSIPTDSEGARTGPTLADRLRPLVERAMSGTLEPGQHAELERTLIDYWRRRLGLQSATPAQAISAIRSDARAGPLLLQLEAWLHRPDHQEEVDVAALLEPYRDLPADELSLAEGPALAGRAG